MNEVYRVKASSGWEGRRTVVLMISVGQPYHEGDKFAATLDWARERFERVVVVVADSLQRWNLEQGRPNGASESVRLGDQWIERNQTVIDNHPGISLIRWSTLLEGDTFESARRSIEQRYYADAGYKTAVDQDALAVSAKNGRSVLACVAYLNEENAMQSVLESMFPGMVIAYPGSNPSSWHLVKQCASVKLKFHHRPGAPDRAKRADDMNQRKRA